MAEIVVYADVIMITNIAQIMWPSV